MTSRGFVSNGLTVRLGIGSRPRRSNRVRRFRNGASKTYGLFTDDGALLGTVANVVGTPALGRNAPTVYLNRSSSADAATSRGTSEGFWHRAQLYSAGKSHVSEGPLGCAGDKPRCTGFVPFFRSAKMPRIAMALMVLLGIGCSSLPSELEPFDGTFDYVAFDADGERVLQGRLVIDVDDDGTLTGTWEIDWVPGADEETPVGPQIGDGSLVGTIAAGNLSIELNPLNSDNNVGLAGELDGNEITGEWEYVSFIGPTASGTFTAAKR